MSGPTFFGFDRAYADQPPEDRLRLGLTHPDADAMWDALGANIDRLNEQERRGELGTTLADFSPFYPPNEPGGTEPQVRPANLPARRNNIVALRTPSDDPLLAVPPAVYVERLTGVHVPPGGYIRCPLPGHDDGTPSFRAFPEPERGVWCWGCNRGGDVYSFAAALWGEQTRGEAFKRLRAALLEELAA